MFKQYSHEEALWFKVYIAAVKGFAQAAFSERSVSSCAEHVADTALRHYRERCQPEEE